MGNLKYVFQRLRRIKQDVSDPELFFLVFRNMNGYCFLKEMENSSSDNERFLVENWKPVVERYAWYRMQLVGTVHTHPDPDRWEPSLDDVSMAYKLDRPYLMHSVYQPRMRRLTWYTDRCQILWHDTLPRKVAR